jgi:hypothetical protein
MVGGTANTSIRDPVMKKARVIKMDDKNMRKIKMEDKNMRKAI